MSENTTGNSKSLPAATLAALGIVFGDIGTSPLYAFRECFADHRHAAAMTPDNLIGAASLIFWALLLVVTAKYIFIILRLDNRGEGGILAMSALVRSAYRTLAKGNPRFVVIAGLVGAALIYADGMLTPAISVLSAVEGLSVSYPLIDHLTVPVSVGILIALFSIQRFGTAGVGKMFGPLVLLWFITLAILGVMGIASQPGVLLALSPFEGISFLFREWKHGMPLLAAVFLAVTGGEALYADLGHFGTRPIRRGWFAVVLPALVLNYLGQAALLSHDPSAIRNPFFLLAPEALRFPLTLLATGAAVVASQALISGAFSLTAQAVQMAIIPRLRILHTSSTHMGQVYVPAVNHFLTVSCIALVIGFGSSTALAGAYGVAIALTMVITTLLFFYAARLLWKWEIWQAASLTMVFLAIDGLFLLANVSKIDDGGWLPLVIAAAITLLMLVWIWGRKRIAKQAETNSLPMELFISELERKRIHRVPGTAVYMTGHSSRTPAALLHNVKHNHVAHECILLLHVEILDAPHANPHEVLELIEMGQGVYTVTVGFGFADTPDLPLALKERLPGKISCKQGRTTYFLGHEIYRVSKQANWFDRLRLTAFAAMARNTSSATGHFHLPPGRVVELGAQVTL